MAYEINVSKDGKHFFATTERSASAGFQAVHLYYVLVGKFPEAEGYKVNVSRIERTGCDVTNNIINGKL